MNLSRAGCPCVRMDATVSMDAERQIATTSNSGIAKMEKGAQQVGKRDLRGGGTMNIHRGKGVPFEYFQLWYSPVVRKPPGKWSTQLQTPLPPLPTDRRPHLSLPVAMPLYMYIVH